MHYFFYWQNDRLGSLANNYWQCGTVEELIRSPDDTLNQLNRA